MQTQQSSFRSPCNVFFIKCNCFSFIIIITTRNLTVPTAACHQCIVWTVEFFSFRDLRKDLSCSITTRKKKHLSAFSLAAWLSNISPTCHFRSCAVTRFGFTFDGLVRWPGGVGTLVVLYYLVMMPLSCQKLLGISSKHLHRFHLLRCDSCSNLTRTLFNKFRSSTNSPRSAVTVTKNQFRTWFYSLVSFVKTNHAVFAILL